MTTRTGKLPAFLLASMAAHALLLIPAAERMAMIAPILPGQHAISVALIDRGERQSTPDDTGRHAPRPAAAATGTGTPDGATPGERDADAAAASDAAMNQLVGELRTRLSEYLVYPLLARRRGWEGTVDLHVRVRADGRVADIHLARSSGYDVLDRSALHAMQQVQRVGVSLAWLQRKDIEMQLPINFKLDGIRHGPPTL